MNICCITNEDYVKFTLAMINSLRINCHTKYNVTCLCVNVTNKSLNLLNKLDVNTIEVNKTLSKVRTLLTPDGTTLTPVWKRNKDYGCMISEEACYCSNMRFNLVARELEAAEHVLFLDVDAIIRKDLNHMLDEYVSNDITIRKTVNEGVAGKQQKLKISEPNNIIYQQGVFLVKSSPSTINFYQTIAELTMSDWKNWNADQIYFYNEIQNYDFVVGQLDSKYRDVATNPIDGGLKETSYIWSGAWTDKYNNERYINEYTKYSYTK